MKKSNLIHHHGALCPPGADENHRGLLLRHRRLFLPAQEYIADPAHYTLNREQKEFLKNQAFHGNELVGTTFKLCLMNLYLHNIGDIYGNVPVTLGDALLTGIFYKLGVKTTETRPALISSGPKTNP